MIGAPPVARPIDAPVTSGLRRMITPRTVLIACCLLLALLPFVTAPGDIIADSKLDLAINPVGYLARAFSLWDPQQFGQLQNQSNGYLVPMGPFFVLGRLAAVPPWITQRLWISAVLIAAFLGTERLAGRLGIGTPWTRAVAGLAYALSPMALTLLGEYSGEYLPQALAPWVILPLAGVTLGDGPRRGLGHAVARSAVAVALCSGINAACTIAALVPAVVFILTRPAAFRWRLLAWWATAVLLATLWWSIPLVLLQKYGFSFLPYTESAVTTTSATSLGQALRGTENWISYLVVDGQPWWLVGYRIANQVLPTLLSGLLAGLGLTGLIRRQMPERRFLLWTALAGLVIISSGHASLGNPLVGPVATLINGPAAAFRNLWKFDPLIRLPIALGLAQLLATARAPRPRAAVIAAAGIGIGGLALPAYLSGLANPGSFAQIPSYWTAAGNWLNSHAGHQAVLLEPGEQFGQYVWGSPLDDVLQPLTTVDWAERDLSSVSSASNERLLDAIDQQLAAGTGSAGLTQVIARMGVKYVVVRDDLDRAVLAGAWPARINQALAESPGMKEVATFGPLVGSAAPDDASNLDPPYPAVEIFQVAGAEPVAAVQPTAGTLRVYGAPESLLTLASEGVLAGRPVLLNDDGAGLPVAGSVLTDSLRRRTRNFGELRTSYSPTLTATQPAVTYEAAADYLEPGWGKYLSVAQYTGVKDVTASSSASDILTIPALWASGLLPNAAVDGDPRTKWESGDWTGPVGQWIQEDFDAPLAPSRIQVTFVDSGAIGPPVSRVVVSTAAGEVTDPVAVTGAAQWLAVPAGRSGWLRITVAGLAWQPETELGAEVAISDILVPGVQAGRAIVAPEVAGHDPSVVVLAKAQPQPSGCMLGSLGWACDPALATPTEEQYGFNHAFYEHSPERSAASGSAVLTDPALVDKYARIGAGEATVTASSSYTDDPADQPRSAFDGNPATGWIASSLDPRPTLTIGWGRARTIDRVTIKRPPGTSGLLPVLITGSGGQAHGAMITGTSSAVTFAPMRTTSLTFTFTPVQAPLQITDVVIGGVPFLSTPSVPFRLRCGLGPLIEVNGKIVPTRVSGTFAALLGGQPLQFTACSPVELAAGANQVTEPSSDSFSVQNVVLRSLGGSDPPAPVAVSGAVVKSWTSSARTVAVTAVTSSYLVVNENFNPGWHAVIDGRQLRAVRLDGWKQAWLLPAGTSGLVTLTYGPDRLYLAAVIGGLALLALVMLVAAWPDNWRFQRSRRRRRLPRRPWLSRGAAAGSGPRRSRLPAALAVGFLLSAAGFWVAGYPGAVIVTAATALFAVAARRAGSSRFWSEISRPWLAACLLLAASLGTAAGQHLQLAGNSGGIASALENSVPQVICLLIVGRLAVELVPVGDELAGIGRAWRTLSEDDPLWAICVAPRARGGRWDDAEFYATGAAEVEAVLARAAELGLTAGGARALDFGCGAGRLTRALAARFELVVGVDIAPAMLDLARRDNPVAARCEFLLNTRPDLALLGDGEFDLVYSSVVLQHLPPGLIRGYLTELARVLRPGGSLVIQLPTRPRLTPRGLAYRCLPPGLLGILQRWLLGYPAPMRMHGLSERRVRRLLSAHGVEVVATAPTSYHPDWHERRYFARARK
ncbi:MAG: alpha-(1-_3)-arabinofuranosyltransferase family protein [Trebonia sp.]